MTETDFRNDSTRLTDVTDFILWNLTPSRQREHSHTFQKVCVEAKVLIGCLKLPVCFHPILIYRSLAVFPDRLRAELKPISPAHFDFMATAFGQVRRSHSLLRIQKRAFVQKGGRSEGRPVSVTVATSVGDCVRVIAEVWEPTVRSCLTHTPTCSRSSCGRNTRTCREKWDVGGTLQEGSTDCLFFIYIYNWKKLKQLRINVENKLNW